MRLRLPGRDESGAIAILTALLMVVVLAVAALGVDIAKQVNERQKLLDTIDAAAQAGAYNLPSSGTLAASDAFDFAKNNDPDLTGSLKPTVGLLCVVASKLSGSIWVVETTQIPATCNPVSASGNYTGIPCNSSICAIPCNGVNDVCNTVKVSKDKPVPYSFAPAIGINAGSTGAVTSAACKGSCGTIPLNPMDVAVVADRTPSMDPADVTAMISGIKGMLQVMTPSQQYVALGSIHRSATTNHSTAACDSTSKGLTWPSTSKTIGQWIPVDFSNNYLNADKTPNANSNLVKGVECLKNQSDTTVRTHLASPLKYAARYLLGYDTNNLPSPETRIGTIRKAIIFETDGQPNETITAGGSATLTDAGDISANSNGALACTNMQTVATNAKAKDILIVTVAFNLSGTLCGSSGSPTVASALAAAASEKSIGVPSSADNTCSTPAERTFENGDGDFFFCATAGATSTEMAKIFVTAFTQIANGIRLIQLPPGA